jgi:hypothetical protein
MDIKKPHISARLFTLVGMTGFEPATPWSQTRCATGLRYIPIFLTSMPNQGALLSSERRDATSLFFWLRCQTKCATLVRKTRRYIPICLTSMPNQVRYSRQKDETLHSYLFYGLLNQETFTILLR